MPASVLAASRASSPLCSSSLRNSATSNTENFSACIGSPPHTSSNPLDSGRSRFVADIPCHRLLFASHLAKNHPPKAPQRQPHPGHTLFIGQTSQKVERGTLQSSLFCLLCQQYGDLVLHPKLLAARRAAQLRKICVKSQFSMADGAYNGFHQLRGNHVSHSIRPHSHPRANPGTLKAGFHPLSCRGTHMPAIMLDGNLFASQIKSEIAEEVQQLAAYGLRPGLAAILVGQNPASQTYVRNKVRTCEQLGILSELITPPESSTTEELIALVEAAQCPRGNRWHSRPTSSARPRRCHACPGRRLSGEGC